MAFSLNNLMKSQKSAIQRRELNKIMARSPEAGLMKACCKENTNWGTIQIVEIFTSSYNAYQSSFMTQ